MPRNRAASGAGSRYGRRLSRQPFGAGVAASVDMIIPLSAASRSAVANVIRPKALAPNWKRLIERLRQTDRCSGRRTASEWLPDLSKARHTTIPRQSRPGHLTSGRRHQRSLQLSPVPATPYFEQLSIGAGRRTLALSLAILITGFLLLMLLFFDPGKPPEKREEDRKSTRLNSSH